MALFFVCVFLLSLGTEKLRPYDGPEWDGSRVGFGSTQPQGGPGVDEVGIPGPDPVLV